MKRIVILAVALMSAGGAFAWHGHHGWHGGFHHHHYHGGFWGRGGCHFWPGFVGGVVGGAIASSYWSRPYYTAPVVVAQPAPVVVPQPVVVQQPVVQPVVQQPVVQQIVQQPVVQAQRVWVEGCYIDQPQPNGTSVRVWNPGHYEMR